MLTKEKNMAYIYPDWKEQIRYLWKHHKLCNQLKLPSCHTTRDLMPTSTACYRDSQTVLEWRIIWIEAEVAILLPGHCPVSHIGLNQTRQTHQPCECLLAISKNALYCIMGTCTFTLHCSLTVQRKTELNASASKAQK